jgi:diphosphomevalonate decarboxylase
MMDMTTATAQAFANIAFIKYWGNKDHHLRLPSTNSISMNLDGLYTRSRVTLDPRLDSDRLTLNGRAAKGPALQRVSAFLDIVRGMSGMKWFAQVHSQNNFPTGVGIASSASAFAALSLAASSAAGLELPEKELSRLARRGSGSACRSVPGGFVEWQAGESDEDSFAYSVAPPGHWDLTDCVAIVSQAHKPTGSTEGHALAETSPLQAARVADAPRRIDACCRAILERNFERFAAVIEQDCSMMHAVMMTSTPSLIYWLPATLRIINNVQEWRKHGLAVCYTIDAGPNVHVISTSQASREVERRLLELPGVSQVLVAGPGGPARLVTDDTIPPSRNGKGGQEG